MTFKVGDKVRRRKEHIDNGTWTSSCPEHLRNFGMVLTVKEISGDISLEEIPNNTFDICKFELITNSSEPIEIKIGDKVIRNSNDTDYNNEIPLGTTGIYKGRYRDGNEYAAVEWDNPIFRTYDCDNMCDSKKGCWVKFQDLKLVSSKLNNTGGKMATKYVFQVLTVNRKTGEIDKDEAVVAADEKQAVLRAYGIDVENLAFEVTRRSEFTEDKPQTVVMETPSKK